MKKKTFLRLLAILYAAAALLLGGSVVLRSLAARSAAPRELSVADAQLSSLLTDRTWAVWQSGSLLSSDTDPQLIWQINGPVRAVRVTLRSSLPVRDPEIYYTTAAGQGYSLSRRLVPSQSDPFSGSYTFVLPRTQNVVSLRLDPTSAAGAFLKVEPVELNPSVSVAPEPAAVLAALFAPFLAALAVREIVCFSAAKGDSGCRPLT